LYLLIVNEASRFLWVFLTKSEEPPLAIVEMFLGRFGHADGGVVRTDQGSELARSPEFCDTILHNYQYVIEPTGADSPSQNGAAEIYNGKLAVRARTLSFGSGLPTKFWSSALLHAVYLHNWLVHTVTQTTPLKFMFGIKPDLSALKIFGSCVCIKRLGKQRSKLDRHNFKGVFLGYTATDQNIVYLDLDSRDVKTSHYAQFDEAWYLQPTRPPAPQLLYDLKVRPLEETILTTLDVQLDFCAVGTVEKVMVPWPPLLSCMPDKGNWHPPPHRVYTYISRCVRYRRSIIP
jgi:hypothetical protein